MSEKKHKRTSKRAKGRLFKFKKETDEYLVKEGNKPGQNMTKILEELLEFRRRFKTFPPTSL